MAGFGILTQKYSLYLHVCVVSALRPPLRALLVALGGLGNVLDDLHDLGVGAATFEVAANVGIAAEDRGGLVIIGGGGGKLCVYIKKW